MEKLAGIWNVEQSEMRVGRISSRPEKLVVSRVVGNLEWNWYETLKDVPRI